MTKQKFKEYLYRCKEHRDDADGLPNGLSYNRAGERKAYETALELLECCPNNDCFVNSLDDRRNKVAAAFVKSMSLNFEYSTMSDWAEYETLTDIIFLAQTLNFAFGDKGEEGDEIPF